MQMIHVELREKAWGVPFDSPRLHQPVDNNQSLTRLLLRQLGLQWSPVVSVKAT